MCGNNGCHISHAAIAAFYFVLVKQLMMPVSTRDMLSHYLQELLADIGGDILIIWWIEPYDIVALLSLVSSCRY